MGRKKYNFCIVTYETYPNPIAQNLKTYLLENYSSDLLYIYHPMLDSKDGYQISSGYYFFKNSKLEEGKKSYHWRLYTSFSYIKDVLYTLIWCLMFKRRFDIYFAAGNLNPVVGILLRSLGVVKKVVYLTQDYYPKRFKNRFLNWLFFQLDRFCVRFSDETWNVSPFMAGARQKKMGMDQKKFNKQYNVPGCIWFYKTKRLTLNKINTKKIVYRGSLLPHMGIDLAIKAMPLILKKIPGLRFEIIGTGEDEERLKNFAHKLGVEKQVLFHGFVESREEMEKILSDGALGIATFNTDVLDNMNSDPGKIKDYMLLGMPVITTATTWLSQEIKKNRCGIVISYNSEAMASAVIKLLKNKRLLKEYRNNATSFIRAFDCNLIYKLNTKRILSRI